ncbi:MAG: hypothetical protein GXP19_01535 [Gammaproteobacteria bacterium]|nr:hypothetical protein [Gammaproteobacteria bacterium]
MLLHAASGLGDASYHHFSMGGKESLFGGVMSFRGSSVRAELSVSIESGKW